MAIRESGGGVKVGDRFGRLEVLGWQFTRGDGHYYAVVACDCGKTACVAISALLSDKTQSCGCLRRKLLRARSLTHGKTQTALYRKCADMQRRCCDPNRTDYCNYGGRGIKFCFPSIIAAVQYVEERLGPKPVGFQIDRIDNNGDYAPGNLRWASLNLQQFNKRYDNQDLSRGVSRKGNKFQIGLSIAPGKKKYFGTYATVEQAASVANELWRRLVCLEEERCQQIIEDYHRSIGWTRVSAA